MVALVTLNKNSKETLRHLLNNLNLGIAAADFGGIFVAFLDGTATKPTKLDADRLRVLVNDLNFGTHKLGFGDLVVNLLDPAKVQTAAAAAVANQRTFNELVKVLDNLNLGLSEIGFGEIFSSAVTAAAQPPAVVKSITAAADKATATGGDTIAFTAMFTTVGAAAADFDFAVNPSSAGAVNAAGLLTLTNNATGAVTVVATAKAAAGAVTGSPATFKITAVTPKKTIAAKTGLTAAQSGTVAFATMFTATNCTAADFDFVVTPVTGSQGGSVDAAGLLTLDADAAASVTVKATKKASVSGVINGSPATATIAVTQP